MIAEPLNVRMGELTASDSAGEVLAAIGLGSCIGLALLDRQRCVAGLAHVMLPCSEGREPGQPGRYADSAVPALIDAVLGLGARSSRLEAVLVGGAAMFAVSRGALEIGLRNREAVEKALESRRIRVAGAETGGSSGRSIRVHVDGCRVMVKQAGEAERELLGAANRLKEVA